MAKPRIESRQFGSRACPLNRKKKRSGCIYLVYFFSYLFDQGILFHALPLAISEKTFQNILIRVIRVNGEGTRLQEQEGGGMISLAVGRRREGIEAA